MSHCSYSEAERADRSAEVCSTTRVLYLFSDILVRSDSNYLFGSLLDKLTYGFTILVWNDFLSIVNPTIDRRAGESGQTPSES